MLISASGKCELKPQRYRFTPVRRIIIKKNTTSVVKNVEKRETLYTVGGNVNCCSHYGKQHGYCSKHLKENYHYDPASPFLGIHPKLVKTLIQKKKIHTPMSTAAIFTVANMWKQPASINR